MTRLASEMASLLRFVRGEAFLFLIVLGTISPGLRFLRFAGPTYTECAEYHAGKVNNVTATHRFDVVLLG